MNKCPVRGYDGLEEPAFDDDGVPSFDICDCCGTQFGYHDAKTPRAVLRERWVADGMAWTVVSIRRPIGIRSSSCAGLAGRTQRPPLEKPVNASRPSR